ncbi:hypothetical protein DL98DRAFT_169347 [Cadophora sp. DSE1049]|nr:hypothetical protein DL98DRAFT_169347 [Cadophora sp. DSE1049]
MAIFDLYPGLEVNVTIDGVALPEYDDDEEEALKPGPVGAYQASRTVTKYIESVSDKELAIEIKLNAGCRWTADLSPLLSPLMARS